MNAYKFKVAFLGANCDNEIEMTGYVIAANYFEAVAKVEKDLCKQEICKIMITWFDDAPNDVIYPI